MRRICPTVHSARIVVGRGTSHLSYVVVNSVISCERVAKLQKHTYASPIMQQINTPSLINSVFRLTPRSHKIGVLVRMQVPLIILWFIPWGTCPSHGIVLTIFLQDSSVKTVQSPFLLDRLFMRKSKNCRSPYVEDQYNLSLSHATRCSMYGVTSTL